MINIGFTLSIVAMVASFFVSEELGKLFMAWAGMAFAYCLIVFVVGEYFNNRW